MIPPLSEWNSGRNLKAFKFNEGDLIPGVSRYTDSFDTSNNIFMTHKDLSIENSDFLSPNFKEFFVKGLKKKAPKKPIDLSKASFLVGDNGVFILEKIVAIQNFSYEEEDVKVSFKTDFKPEEILNGHFFVKSFTVKVEFKSPF